MEKSLVRPWYPVVAKMLAAGSTAMASAQAVGASVQTVRRHLHAPGSVLASMVAQERTKLRAVDDANIAAGGDDLAPLRGKALAVLERALDAGDTSAAKALLGKLVANPPDAPQAEAEPEPEITPEEAARETALALPAAADLARSGVLSPEVAELLRDACRAFLADDLQPRPPLDAEADRVEVVLDEPAPVAPPPPSSPAAEAVVVPLRPLV